MKPTIWIAQRIVSWIAAHCDHPSHLVVADIAEGDIAGRSIRWCRSCGSINRTFGQTTGWEWPKDPWRRGPIGAPRIRNNRLAADRPTEKPLRTGLLEKEEA